MVILRSKILMLICCAFFLHACSSNDKDLSLEQKASAEELYESATEKLGKGNYEGAVQDFIDIERTYPYSPLATKAKLMSGYTQYRNEEYDAAVSSLERFIKFHPGNKDVSYAYYLKALCYYEQITDVGRDQGVTEQAEKALKEVVARFPESEYARDSKLKIDLVRDHLAGKEMEVGRFYLNKKQLIAAVSRFQNVVRDYETTAHVPEALHRLVESYLLLGVVPEAQKNAAVLGANYPGSHWYEKSYDLMLSKGFKVKAVSPKKGSETGEESGVIDAIWPFGGD